MATPKGGVVRLQVSSQYALLLPKVPNGGVVPMHAYLLKEGQNVIISSKTCVSSSWSGSFEK